MEEIIISNEDIYNETIVNEIINLASTTPIILKITNENVRDSNVVNNITIFLSKSLEFENLIEAQKSLENAFSSISEDDVSKRIEISSKIYHQKEVIKRFIKDILVLAKQFNRVDINADRLKKAKSLFEAGEFEKSRTVLESDLEEIEEDQKRLLEEREQNNTKLKINSDEFLILALSTISPFLTRKEYSTICQYFEKSIDSYSSKNNHGEYADFLLVQSQLPSAERHYDICLKSFEENLSLQEKASILNNLGLIQASNLEIEKAIETAKKSLTIWKNLAEGNSLKYLPRVLDSLVQIGNWYSSDTGVMIAIDFYEEALSLLKQLQSQKENYLFYISNGLAISHEKIGLFHFNMHQEFGQKKSLDKATFHIDTAFSHYNQALAIAKELAKKSPEYYLINVAVVLNNLGGLNDGLLNYEESIKQHKEALDISYSLFNKNPYQYLPDVLSSLINIAHHYFHSVHNEQEAIKYATQVINMGSPIINEVPYVKLYIERASLILQALA